MEKHLLSASPSSRTFFRREDDKIAIQTVADVESVLKLTHGLRTSGQTRAANGDRHVAEIPVVVLNEWAGKRGVTYDAIMRDNRLMREFLNDPANSQFRVHGGRV